MFVSLTDGKPGETFLMTVGVHSRFDGHTFREHVVRKTFFDKTRADFTRRMEGTSSSNKNNLIMFSKTERRVASRLPEVERRPIKDKTTKTKQEKQRT